MINLDKSKFDSFWMAPLSPSETGLKMNIWISPGIPGYKFRIYVQGNHCMKFHRTVYPVFKDKNIKAPQGLGRLDANDFFDIKKFITQNKKILYTSWCQKELNLKKIINELIKV